MNLRGIGLISFFQQLISFFRAALSQHILTCGITVSVIETFPSYYIVVIRIYSNTELCQSKGAENIDQLSQYTY